jgi:hypothetical protein
MEPSPLPRRAPPRSALAVRPGATASGEIAVLTGRVEVVVISIMIIANVVQTSGLLDIFFPTALQVSLAIQFGTILVYCVVAAIRAHVRVLVLAGLFAALVIASCYNYASITGSGVNLNAALSLLGMLMLVVYYESRLPLGTILLILLVVSTVYVVLYDILAPMIASSSDVRTSLASDGIRDRRAFLAALFASYVLCSGLLMLRTRPAIGAGLMLVSGYAIYIAHSRMFQAILLITMAAAVAGALMPRLRRPIGVVLAAVFVGLCVANLWGFFDPGWNPYEIVMDDSSGRARYIQYGDARRVFGDRHLFGIGLAPSIDQLAEYVKPRTPFFPSDLGPAGVYFQFGLLGTALFLILSVACIVAHPGRHIRATPLSQAMHYVALNAALGGFFGITILGGSGTPFAMLTIALWLKGGYFSPVAGRNLRSAREIAPEAFGLPPSQEAESSQIRRTVLR